MICLSKICLIYFGIASTVYMYSDSKVIQLSFISQNFCFNNLICLSYNIGLVWDGTSYNIWNPMEIWTCHSRMTVSDIVTGLTEQALGQLHPFIQPDRWN